jgi:hypothetical protein
MLPDIDGTKDTLSVSMITSGWSSEGADSTIVVNRNNRFIAVFQADRYGDITAQQLAEVPDIASDPGVMETLLAVFSDKALMGKLQGALNKCENDDPVTNRAISGLCLSCKIHKIALLAMVAVTPSEIRMVRNGHIAANAAKAAEYSGRALAADAAAGAAAATVDEFWECDQLCAIGDCQKTFNGCVEDSLTEASTAQCKADLALCCKAAKAVCAPCSARRGPLAKAGTFCCCAIGNPA